MPVPSVLTDLTVLESTNNPVDTETVTPTTRPSDYLRAHASLIRRMRAQGAAVASAATVDLGAVTDGEYLNITGVVTITSFGTIAAGVERTLVFTGILTLTHNATSLILRTGANRTTVVGDVAVFVSEGAGNWREKAYHTSDATLTSLAALDATPGLVEQTGADAFTKRVIGAAATTSIPRVSDHLGSQTVGVPAGAMKPRLTAGAVPATIALSPNDTLVASHNYDPAAENFAQFTIPAPKSFNSAIALTGVFEWSHPATTTNFGVAWAVRSKYVRDADPMDGPWSAFVQVVDTGGVTDSMYVSPVTAGVTPAGIYAENCSIMFEVKRAAADAADTLAVTARLQRFAFKYSTSALNDA